MTSTAELLVDEVRPDVFRLAINRPPANALNLAVTRALLERLGAFAEAKRTPAVVLTGAGDRFFCAGGDIKEVQGIAPEVAVERIGIFHRLLVAIEQYPGPFVAAVRGYAVGAGFELVLFSDYVVASRDARVGFPEIKHGLLPAVKGMRHAAVMLGRKAARSLLYTGELIDVERAAALGIVDAVTDTVDVDARAIAAAAEMAAKDPLLFSLIKRSMDLTGGYDDAAMERATMEDMRAYIGREETVAARAAFTQRKSS